MKALAIAAVNVRRMLRERSNVFFVFVFPMLLILVLGVSFGGAFEPKIGVFAVDAGPARRRPRPHARGDPGRRRRAFETLDDMRTAVERGQLQAGIVLPEGYDAALRAGQDVQVRYLARQDQLGLQLSRDRARGGGRAGAAAPRRSLLRRPRDAGAFDEGLARADVATTTLAPVEVVTTTAGEAIFPASLGRFDPGASSQLLLFIFLTSHHGAVALIETRRLGVSRRMLSTPTPARTIVAGEALGRFGIAMVQGLFIMLGSLFVFGVDWGEPLGSAALLVPSRSSARAPGCSSARCCGPSSRRSRLAILLGLGPARSAGAWCRSSSSRRRCAPWRTSRPRPGRSTATRSSVRRNGTMSTSRLRSRSCSATRPSCWGSRPGGCAARSPVRAVRPETRCMPAAVRRCTLSVAAVMSLAIVATSCSTGHPGRARRRPAPHRLIRARSSSSATGVVPPS